MHLYSCPKRDNLAILYASISMMCNPNLHLLKYPCEPSYMLESRGSVEQSSSLSVVKSANAILHADVSKLDEHAVRGSHVTTTSRIFVCRQLRASSDVDLPKSFHSNSNRQKW